MSLEDVVSVSIDRETAVVDQKSFDVIALLTADANTFEPISFVSSAPEAASNLWGGVNSLTYKAVEQIFSQTPRCKRLGLIQIKQIFYLGVSNGTFTAGSFSMVINGVRITSGMYTTDKSTTINQFCANINAAIPGVTAGYSSGMITINPQQSYGGRLSVKSIDISQVVGTMDIYEMATVPVILTGTVWTEGSITTVINGITVTTAYTTNLNTTLTAHASAILTAASAYVSASVFSSDRFMFGFKKNVRPVITSMKIVRGASDTIAVSEMTIGARDEVYTNIQLLNNAREYDDNWYGLGYIAYNTALDATLTEVKAIADWAEANNKIFAYTSRNANIIDTSVSSDATSIAAYVKNKSYGRTKISYSPDCDGTSDAPEYPGLALLGKMFPKTPGSWTGEFKNLKGITSRTYTTTQKANAKAKNVGLYLPIGGKGCYVNAKVAEGEWLDTIVFCDWMKSLIKTNVFAPFVNSDKIPYDDDGIGMLGSKVAGSLESGITSGGFTKHAVDEDGAVTGGYVVILPKAADISDNDKNQRFITSTNPIKFIGYLAGAIHAVTIQGKVTV